MADTAAESPAESPPSPGQPSTTTPVPRACNACRARKIRCNREVPCSHCVHAKIECTHADTRPKEKRTRILLTTQYEKKIDLIDRRLEGVVQLLQDVKSQLASTPPPQPPQPSPIPPQPQLQQPSLLQLPKRAPSARTTPGPSCTPSPASHTSSHAGTTGPLVEGESSLTAHSIFAKDLLQKAVRTNADPEMRANMDDLRHIIDAMRKQPAEHEMTYPNALPLPSVALPEGCVLPPIEKSVRVLKLAKAQRFSGISWMFEFFPMQHFPETCLSVYFSGDYNVGDFIMVNAGLHYLFLAFSEWPSLPEEDRDECLQLSRMCRTNLETALSNLPLHLPATQDIILALLLGAYHAVEISKPTLGWVLSSKASELCQTLGYHRIDSYKNTLPEDAHYRQFLFWAVYVVDKGLALRLGRSPTVQEYDVTVPYPTSDHPHMMYSSAFMRLWIIAAKVQGQIYEQLYSPRAITEPDEVRMHRVQTLARELDELEVETQQSLAELDRHLRSTFGDELSDFFVISDEVLRLSLRALVYRAVPHPPGSLTTFRTECIQAARATLERHQECIDVVEKSKLGLFTTYMHWTILFAPFVPFIVLFCQVIETCDREDLARLQAFVSSIEQSSDNTTSEAITKLYRLFRALCTVAQRHVEAQSTPDSQTSVDPNQTGTGVDTYLAALGFPPTGPQVMITDQHHQQQPHQPHAFSLQNQEPFNNMIGESNGEQPRAVNPMIWMGNGVQLEDWFYSNQEMMDLLGNGNLNNP